MHPSSSGYSNPPTRLDHFVTLGRSGLRVSPFCLGAMTFGEDWPFGASVEESVKVMDAYIDAGGNFIDTANIYTKGHSEKIMGDHLGKDRAKRDRLVIATKFYASMRPGDPNAGGGGRKNMIESCEQSLRRLQTDFIDLYWLHAMDPFTPIEETLRGMDDLVRAGKVRYIGFSDNPAWVVSRAQTIAELRNMNPLCALQLEYSLIERTIEGELVPCAQELGMGITPWSPLKGGLLSGKYTRQNMGEGVDSGRADWLKNRLQEERVLTIIDTLIEVASALGRSPAEVALAWVQSQPGVTSTIIGARTLSHLEKNLKALEVEIPAEHLAKLKEASAPQLNFPHEFLGRSGPFRQADTTINGFTAENWDLAPQNDEERW